MDKEIAVIKVSDGTDTVIQCREVAKHLSPSGNIKRLYKDEELPENIDSYDLAIGVGFNVTEKLLEIKTKTNGKIKIAIILDPLAHHEKFDFIILPSYEPYKISGSNVIRTTGLINFVNENYLAAQRFEFENHPKYQFLRNMKLKPPFLSVIIGGRHTGGNINEEDCTLIARKVNEIVSHKGGAALITTSKRSEIFIPEILRNLLNIPYFLYDYKSRNTENPYGVLLALASEIIVTGESVRMMSETCSSGKLVRIYRPKTYGFQYKPLIDELINSGYAIEFNSDLVTSHNIKKLDEAKRIADLIKSGLFKNS